MARVRGHSSGGARQLRNAAQVILRRSSFLGTFADVRDYGAVGDYEDDADPGTDDAAALNACAADCRANGLIFYVPYGVRCRASSHVDLWGIRQVAIDGEIHSDAAGIGVTAGYDARSVDSQKYYFGTVRKIGSDVSFAGAPLLDGTSGATSDIALRLQGIKNADVHVQRCSFLQLWADGGNDAENFSAIYSLAYNTFTLGNIARLDVQSETTASQIGWINENRFFGGRVICMKTGGNYHHNQNVFIGLCCEAGTLVFDKWIRNHILWARSEAGTTITFSAATWDNEIEDAFVSNPNIVAGAFVVASDAGTGNLVTSYKERRHRYENLFSLTARSPFYAGGLGRIRLDTPNIEPGITRAYVEADEQIAHFRVTPGADVHRYRLSSDAAIHRLWLRFLDENGAVVAPSTSYVGQPSGWFVGGDYLKYGVDTADLSFVLRELSDYAAVEVTLYSGASGGTFEYLRFDAYGISFRMMEERLRVADELRAVPVVDLGDGPPIGLVERGEQVPFSNAGLSQPYEGYHEVARVYDTTTTAASSSGAASINVPTAAFFSVGDTIGVEMVDGRTHWGRVVGVGTSVTFSPALTADVASGAAVHSARWHTREIDRTKSAQATYEVYGTTTSQTWAARTLYKRDQATRAAGGWVETDGSSTEHFFGMAYSVEDFIVGRGASPEEVASARLRVGDNVGGVDIPQVGHVLKLQGAQQLPVPSATLNALVAMDAAGKLKTSGIVPPTTRFTGTVVAHEYDTTVTPNRVRSRTLTYEHGFLKTDVIGSWTSVAASGGGDAEFDSVRVGTTDEGVGTGELAVEGDATFEADADVLGTLTVGANINVDISAHIGSNLYVDDIRQETSGHGIQIGAVDTKIGFNVAPIARPSVIGSRGGNVALASLLTALEDLGLITDDTTA